MGSKTLTIGIDVSRANHDKKTGVEWYAWHVVEKMKKLNTEDTHFVLYSDKPLQGELAKLPDNWQSKVLRWPPKRLWTQIRLSWEMLFNPPDILFIPAHVFPIVHPKKTVMTVHDVAALRFPESYNWFERWYSVWSAKYAVKNLWRIITPSNFVKDSLSSDCHKIFSIPHGYDHLYKKIEDKDKISKVLQKYGINKPFLLSVGRLEKKKNTERIVEAFDKLNLQLVLIGKPGHGYERVEKAINESPNKDRIILPGYVGDKDLPYIMNAAEVFVFPSLYEGFGLPVIEAMACGIPVVASRGSSLEEVGADACVYVDPEDVDDITAGIKGVMENEDLRKKSIELGLQHVEGFSWQKSAKKTLDLLLS